jgi:hypothetical protein
VATTITTMDVSADMVNNKKLTINGIEKLKGNLLRDRYVIDRVETKEYQYDIEATHGAVPHRFKIRLGRYAVFPNHYDVHLVWYNAWGGGIHSDTGVVSVDGLQYMDVWLVSLSWMLKVVDKS